VAGRIAGFEDYQERDFQTKLSAQAGDLQAA